MGLCLSVCLSVCVRLSVTSRSSTKTAKHRITQTTPHDTPKTLVFCRQRCTRNSTGVTPCEGAECRWGGSKVADFDPPHLHSAPSQGVTPVEFRGDLWRQKTRGPGLSCGVVCVILRSAVLVELRLVTDTDTDRHKPMASTADA